MAKCTTTVFIVDISLPAAPFLPAIRDALTAAIMVKAAKANPAEEVAVITFGGAFTDNAPAAEDGGGGGGGGGGGASYAGIVNATRAAARARWGGPPPGAGAVGADADGAVAAGLLSVWHPARRAAALAAVAGLGGGAGGGGGGATAAAAAAPAPPSYPPDAMDALLVAADAVTKAADAGAGGRAALSGRGAATRFVVISPLGTPPPAGPVDADAVGAFVASAATLGATLTLVVAHPPADPVDGPVPPPPSHPGLAALAPLLAALPSRVELRVGSGPEGVAGALADPGVGSSVYWTGELELLAAPAAAAAAGGGGGGGEGHSGEGAAAGPGSRGASPPAAPGEVAYALEVKLSKRTSPAHPPKWESVVEASPSEGGGGAAAAAAEGGHWVKVDRATTYRPAGAAAAAAAAAAGEPGAADAPAPMAVDHGARIRAWGYGGEWVPVPDAVSHRLGFGGAKSLRLVGWAVPAPPLAAVASGGAWLMAPSAGAGAGNRAALAALVRATRRAGGAAILRWIARGRGGGGGEGGGGGGGGGGGDYDPARGAPRLYAAYPAEPGEFDVTGEVGALEAEIAAALGGGARLPPTHPDCFVLVELPFLEDVRPLRFPGFPVRGDGEGGGDDHPTDAPTPAQQKAAIELVDAWDASRRAPPEALPNPVRARALAWVGARAAAVADGAVDFPQPIPPPPRLGELAERTEGGAGVAAPPATDAAARCVYAGPGAPGTTAAAAAADFALAFESTVRQTPEPGEKERAERAEAKKKKQQTQKGRGRGRGQRSPSRSE